MPEKHLQGQGCKKCGYDKSKNINKMSLEKFIEKCKEIHNENNYNYDKINYINNYTHIDIYCNRHNLFFKQKPSHHLRGNGCKKCGNEKRCNKIINISSHKFYNLTENDNRYDFSNFVYEKYNIKSKLICNKCKKNIELSPNNYLKNIGCPLCININKTENKLYNNIINNYFLIKQPKYNWCKNIKTNNYLPFDFSIEEYKIIIEVDGIQHFKDVPYFKSLYNERKKIDLYKQLCANNNGYSLIRIFQQDIYLDRLNWIKELFISINKIINEKKIQNLYISTNNIYKDFEII